MIELRCPWCGTTNRIPDTRAGSPARCGRCGQPLATTLAPVGVTDANFEAIVTRASAPVLLDCWADWCGPCHALAPTIDDIARAHGGRLVVGKLDGDARASLLVTQPGGASDPLAAGRVTLMGEASRAGDSDLAAVRAAYLERHPTARYWADFDDFSFWRLEVSDVYFVGGFAAMGWVDAADYRRSRPDPLSDAAARIMEHMNRDHADALVAYARFFAGAEADEAPMTAVYRLGL